jgi:hypothetical protein
MHVLANPGNPATIQFAQSIRAAPVEEQRRVA